MRHYKRANIYKSGRAVLKIEPLEAWSYDWWCFLRKVRGKVVFNNYHYSNTTGKHQSAVSTQLKALGIKVDLFVYSPKSLDSRCNSALEYSYQKLFEARVKLENSRIRPETRAAEERQVAGLERDIAALRAIGAQCSKARRTELQREVETAERERLERARTRKVRDLEVERVKRAEAKELLNSSWVNVG